MQVSVWKVSPLSWDTVIGVLHPNAKTSHNADFSINFDYIPPNAKLFSGTATLYIFEDNDAFIEQVNKGRSPTMRHKSRTHRENLEWLYDHIILDPTLKVQIKT